MSSIKLDKSTIAVVYAQMQASKSTLSKALTSLSKWAHAEATLNIFSRSIYKPGLNEGDPPLIDYRENAKAYINSANSICTHVGYLDKIMDDFNSILDALDGIKDAIEDFELQPICLPGEDPSKYGFITSVQLTSGRYGYNSEMGIDITSELMDPEYMLATLGNSGDVTEKGMKNAYKEWLSDYGKWVNEQTKAYVTENGLTIDHRLAWLWGPLSDRHVRENASNRIKIYAGNFCQATGAFFTDTGALATGSAVELVNAGIAVVNTTDEIIHGKDDRPGRKHAGVVNEIIEAATNAKVDIDVVNEYMDSFGERLCDRVGGFYTNNGYNIKNEIIHLGGQEMFQTLATGEVIGVLENIIMDGATGSSHGKSHLGRFVDPDREQGPMYALHTGLPYKEKNGDNLGYLSDAARGSGLLANTLNGTGENVANIANKINADMPTGTGGGAGTQAGASAPPPTQNNTPPAQNNTPPAQNNTPPANNGGNNSPAPPPAETPKPAASPKPAEVQKPAEAPKSEVKPAPEAKPEPASTPDGGSSKPNIEPVKTEVKPADLPKDKSATSVIDVVKNHADSDKVASAGVAAMTIGVGSALSKTVPGVGVGGGSSVSIPDVSLGGGGNMNIPSATTATIGGSPGGMGGASGMGGSYGMGGNSSMGGGSGMGLGTSGSGDVSMTSSGITQTGGGLTASNSGTIPHSGRVYNNNTFADQLEQSTRSQDARNASAVKSGTSSTNANGDATQTDSKTHNNKSSYTNVGDEKVDDSEARKKMQDLSKKVEAPDENKDKEESSDKKKKSDAEKKQEAEDKKNEENKNEEKKDVKTTTKENLSSDEGLVGSNSGYVTGKDKSISKIAVEITAGEILISAVLFALKVLNILAFILVIVAIILLYSTYRITHKKIIEKRKKQYLISLEKVVKEEKLDGESEEVTTDSSTSIEPEQVTEEQVAKELVVEEQTLSNNDSSTENEEVETENNKDLIIPPMKDNPNFEEFGTGLDFVDKE